MPTRKLNPIQKAKEFEKHQKLGKENFKKACKIVLEVKEKGTENDWCEFKKHIIISDENVLIKMMLVAQDKIIIELVFCDGLQYRELQKFPLVEQRQLYDNGIGVFFPSGKLYENNLSYKIISIHKMSYYHVYQAFDNGKMKSLKDQKTWWKNHQQELIERLHQKSNNNIEINIKKDGSMNINCEGCDISKTLFYNELSILFNKATINRQHIKKKAAKRTVR